MRELPGQDDAWAAGLIDRLTRECGTRLGALWKVRLDRTDAPSLGPWLQRRALRLGDLLRSPDDREERLPAVPLLLLRGDDAVLGPDDDVVLQAEDQLLLAGGPVARRALEKTLMVDAVPEYLISGRRVPSGWLWRRLTHHESELTR